MSTRQHDAAPHGPAAHHPSPRAHDLLTSVLFAGRHRATYCKLAVLSGTKAGDRVVDVGCGTGYFTRVLAAAAGPGGQVVGIDPSEQALIRARQLTSFANCSFTAGEGEHLELEDSTVDVAVSSLAIHHLPEDHRPLALAEMSRALRPGGRVLVADFSPPTNPLLRRLIHPVTSPAMEHNPVHLLGPMLGQAGFEDVTEGDVKPLIHYATGTKPR